MQDSEQKKLLDLKGCSGQILWQGKVLDVQFNLECSVDGNILIEFEDQILSQDNYWLNYIYLSNHPMTEKFELNATHYESWKINTKNAYLIECAISSDTTESRLKARASALSVELLRQNGDVNEDKDLWNAQYLIVGLRSFGRVQTESNVGTVVLEGPAKLEDFTKVSGAVLIRGISHTNDFDTWVEACDDLVRNILIVLSLADGRMIHWSIRQLFWNDINTRVTLLGRKNTSKPYKPIFSHLHLRPILELAVNAHETGQIEKTGLRVAGEWYLMAVPYLEGRFISGMIALEHLIYVHSIYLNRGGRFPKEVFTKTIAPVLLEALNSLMPMLLDVIPDLNIVNGNLEEMKHSLSNLNNRSFRSQAEQLISDHNIPLNGLPNQVVRDLFHIRHQIVHRGLSPDAQEFPLSHYLSVLEELLTRIFLSILGYKGNYNTYFKQVGYVKFPPSD